MEHSSQKIVDIILTIIPLLEAGNSQYWLGYFNYILNSIRTSDNHVESVMSIRSALTGSMGSFADLVLHKNKKPLIAENDELYEL